VLKPLLERHVYSPDMSPGMRGTEDEGSATTSYFKNVSGKLKAF
jgi:hypothetical protein